MGSIKGRECLGTICNSVDYDKAWSNFRFSVPEEKHVHAFGKPRQIPVPPSRLDCVTDRIILAIQCKGKGKTENNRIQTVPYEACLIEKKHLHCCF